MITPPLRMTDLADNDGRRMRLPPQSDPHSGEPVGLPPVVEGLLMDIVADGFVLYCCGHRAGPNALVASYQWEHCMDLVTIRDFEWVAVARVPTPHPGQVDVFAPEVVMWAREGLPQWALRALLNLVHPAHPKPPTPPLRRHHPSTFPALSSAP